MLETDDPGQPTEAELNLKVILWRFQGIGGKDRRATNGKDMDRSAGGFDRSVMTGEKFSNCCITRLVTST
jgi:hypothetical protein